MPISKIGGKQMFKKKKKTSFEEQVYSFYKEHNIPFENPPTRSPEECGRLIVEEMKKNRLSENQGPLNIRLSGTAEPNKLV